ncbi:hypothetical protein Tdes44962_MAKER09896 [Teratosphaeria destructans]|uniref:DUF7053 domain-containing protein n=1 Tax=Teratosphaeria destructans TaxID=418781 RepID=A0A9W7SR05_9PEZI|nr:hypothetical protein Tdes44962_MAKER09896 [Teratosphaeria destructans]
MFETNFSHASATPLPPGVHLEQALPILHDFETVMKLNPDCKGCKRIPPPAQKPSKNGLAKTPGVESGAAGQITYYEVEDDLPFMPKRLWAGGVRYMAEFLPTEDGCDITVHAPGGFTSTNHWRILRETIPEESAPTLVRVASKDLLHQDTREGMGGGTWFVQIISDAKCNKTFVSIVKGFLRNSHQQLQNAFIEKLKAPVAERQRRPTLGRRRSSEL